MRAHEHKHARTNMHTHKVSKFRDVSFQHVDAQGGTNIVLVGIKAFKREEVEESYRQPIRHIKTTSVTQASRRVHTREECLLAHAQHV